MQSSAVVAVAAPRARLAAGPGCCVTVVLPQRGSELARVSAEGRVEPVLMCSQSVSPGQQPGDKWTYSPALPSLLFLFPGAGTGSSMPSLAPRKIGFMFSSSSLQLVLQ